MYMYQYEKKLGPRGINQKKSHLNEKKKNSECNQGKTTHTYLIDFGFRRLEALFIHTRH